MLAELEEEEAPLAYEDRDRYEGDRYEDPLAHLPLETEDCVDIEVRLPSGLTYEEMLAGLEEEY